MAFTYNPYKESDSVAKKRKELEENEALAPKWNGSTYDTAINDLVSRIQNREPFSYDVNADALYQQYKDQYMNAGRLAMQDTMGKAAALTGGYGNSYADMVGNQAYQAYLEKMNAVVPELYGMAYEQYQDEGEDLKDQYSLLANQRNNEYNIYHDALSRWQNDNTRLTNAYNTERNFDYNKYVDDYTRAYSEYAKNSTLMSEAKTNIENYVLAADREWDEQELYDYLTRLVEMGVLLQNDMDELFQAAKIKKKKGSEAYDPKMLVANYQKAKGEPGSREAATATTTKTTTSKAPAAETVEKEEKKKKTTSNAGGTYTQRAK